MKKDSQELENQLTGQQVADLNEQLLDRLEAAAEGTLTELNQDEVKFESQLRAIRPQALSPQLLASLEAKVEGLPAPTQVSVLPFPGTRRVKEDQVAPTRFSWAAAAAVLLLGVISAFWLDPMGDHTSTVDNPPPSSGSVVQSPSPSVLPAEFSRALNEAQSEGIIWRDNDKPHQVIKVTYTDRVSMEREDGSTYVVEKPRVEYYLVPTESH